MKTLFCHKCGTRVAVIAKGHGSSIQAGAVMLCRDCVPKPVDNSVIEKLFGSFRNS